MSFTAEGVGQWVVGSSRQWVAEGIYALGLADSNPGQIFLDLGRREEGKKMAGFFANYAKVTLLHPAQETTPCS
jgi:hypothetical protein